MGKRSVSKADAENMVLEEIPDKKELEEELVEESASKEWKTHGTTGAKKVAKKCKKSKRKKNMTEAQLRNLRQFRDKDESDEESKKNSLENLRVPAKKESKEPEPTVDFPEEILEPDLLRQVLTIDEQKYFIRRWKEYMSEHQRDFNSAEDYDSIVELMMNYIQLYRIEKKQKNAPTLAYDRSVDFVKHNIHIRIRNLKIDLKTRRKDRLETKESRQSKMLGVITDLAKNSQSGLRDVLEENLKQQLLSEKDMITRKQERAGIIDVD